MRETEVIYHTTSDVARRFGVVPDRIRQLARAGRLKAAIVTRSGQRLFGEAEVSRFEAERYATDAARRRTRRPPATCNEAAL